jgi:hypothetical protein
MLSKEFHTQLIAVARLLPEDQYKKEGWWD